MPKALADIASQLLRAVSPTSIKLFFAVFSVSVLWRLPRIQAGLSAWAFDAQNPALLELAPPLVYASAAASVWALGAPAAHNLRLRLSPVYRFRHLASRADELASALSDSNNYLPRDITAEETPPLRATPHLETKIASFDAELAALGFTSTPPVSDVFMWRRVVPLLRRWISTGDLAGARTLDWADDRVP